MNKFKGREIDKVFNYIYDEFLIILVFKVVV